MKNLNILLFIISISLSACAQKNAQNPYGLKIINDYKVYKADYKTNPNNELIEIKKAIPSVVLDIRYATKNNFMQQVMYNQAKAFARKPVVEHLKKIQAVLKTKGYGLKIFDAYRPYAITIAFWEKASDKNFVANPNKGSKHNRGCAIDLTIIDLKTGKDVPMPTPYDSFAPEAAPHFEKLPAAIIKNRGFLIATMQANGFKVIYNEWWHFDFNGWQDYDLMDIPFEKL
ncbi:M15 family metallopeptidase [Pedobacter frigiditerrae]|uniref:M15 family metallopeptidase n=1 Tax=Pedobacter frigiditerrae TaxID=2530452 RepID=UPI0029304B6A|nr:M15 family metallopeptidase [Pedobacter frigiditerrae]